MNLTPWLMTYPGNEADKPRSADNKHKPLMRCQTPQPHGAEIHVRPRTSYDHHAVKPRTGGEACVPKGSKLFNRK